MRGLSRDGKKVTERVNGAMKFMISVYRIVEELKGRIVIKGLMGDDGTG